MITWNEAAKAKLFAGVLATSDVKVDCEAVAAFMGEGCTAKAISHQIANIRKQAKESAGNLTVPATPKNRKRAKPKAEAEEEEDVGGETPAKQAKKTTANSSTKAKLETAREPAVKEESGDENDVDEAEDSGSAGS